MRLLCRLSQGCAVGGHGQQGPDLRLPQLGGGQHGSRSVRERLSAAAAHPSMVSVPLQAMAVAVRTFEKNWRDLFPRSKTCSQKDIRMVLSGSSGTGHRGKLLHWPMAGLGTPLI